MDRPTCGVDGPVAMITGTYPALSMTFIDREVRAMRALGCPVFTFTLRAPPPKSLSGAFQRKEARGVVCLFASMRRPIEVAAACVDVLRRPRRLASATWLAISTCPADARAVPRQAAYLAAAIMFARHLNRLGIKHVHNHLGDSSGTVAMLAAELTGLPFSMTVHGPEIFEEARRWRLDVKIARARFVCCISRFGRTRAMRIADPQHWHKLKIVRCGVEPEIYRESHVEAQGQRLLFVGRLEVRKGIATLIKAVGLMRDRGRSVSLTIVGDGSERGRAEGLIAERGLDGQIVVAGSQDEPGVAAAMSRADALIVPSLSEGLPVVIMEAFACGLPVVASAVDGIPEIVRHGRTGMLVPPADPAALADTIERVLDDPDLRRRIGVASRRLVFREHDARRNARRLLDCLADSHPQEKARERKAGGSMDCPGRRNLAARPEMNVASMKSDRFRGDQR